MRERWHGTVGGYTNHACRCGRCREAFAAYMRAYCAKKKAAGVCVGCTRRADAGVRCRKHVDMQNAAYRKRQGAI